MQLLGSTAANEVWWARSGLNITTSDSWHAAVGFYIITSEFRITATQFCIIAIQVYITATELYITASRMGITASRS